MVTTDCRNRWKASEIGARPIGVSWIRFRPGVAVALASAAVFAIVAPADDGAPESGSVSTHAVARSTPISTMGSERATSGGGNKIVTLGGKTHVVWQDATDAGYLNQIRTLEHSTGTWTKTVTLNQGVDNHARPVLTVDSKGYLHAIMSGHNSPVTHRRSLRANDSSEWSPPAEIGKGTYPIVTCGPDDSLYVTMRNATRWNGVDLYVRRPGGSWKHQCKLVKRHEDLPGYAAFHGGLSFGADGTLHCVVDFYEGLGVMDRRGLHQAVCYLRSRDGGLSWEKADGTPISLPARPEQLDILARTTEDSRREPMPPPEVLAQGCIVAGADDVPHVLYISHLEKPGELIHARPGPDGSWEQHAIAAGIERFPNHRPTGCRGALTRSADGTLFALIELQPLNGDWVNGKPSRKMNFNAADKHLAWFISRDNGNHWEARLALPEGAIVNQANVERPTGVNMPAADRLPSYVYFDGLSRYREAGELIQNTVYFVR